MQPFWFLKICMFFTCSLIVWTEGPLWVKTKWWWLKSDTLNKSSWLFIFNIDRIFIFFTPWPITRKKKQVFHSCVSVAFHCMVSGNLNWLEICRSGSQYWQHHFGANHWLCEAQLSHFQIRSKTCKPCRILAKCWKNNDHKIILNVFLSLLWSIKSAVYLFTV